MYNVAFVYTREAGGYEGVVTWTSFASKEKFDEFYTDEIKARERVVEEGISPERCVELVNRTPAACRIAAAFEEAKDPGTGEIDSGVLSLHLFQAQFASANR